MGGIIGGIVADKLSAWRPGYGRILTAQLSVGSGLPMIALLTHLTEPFKYVRLVAIVRCHVGVRQPFSRSCVCWCGCRYRYGTAGSGLVLTFCIVVFAFGSVTTWCAWAVNR